MISNWNKFFGLHGLYNNNSGLISADEVRTYERCRHLRQRPPTPDNGSTCNGSRITARLLDHSEADRLVPCAGDSLGPCAKIIWRERGLREAERTCLSRRGMRIPGGGEGAGEADTFNSLTAGAAYIRVLFFLLAHQVPPFKHVKDKMWHQSARFKNSWPPFCQIWIIFTHLKLWIASARHYFKWVKIQIE